jgi:hypothetical protein
MIKSNELREGNMFQYFIGEEGCEWEHTKIDWQDIKWAAEKPENFNEVHKPILLREALTHLGFKLSNPKLLFLPVPEIKAEIHFEIHNYGNVITIHSDFGNFIPNDIDYVHQFQNLYFSLTGRELQHTL